MAQEDKELLLKDLCARFPYGVICKCTYPINNETTYGEDVSFTDDYEIEGIRRVGVGFAGDRRWYEITFGGETYDINDDSIKVVPYLRLLSSMSEEEKTELFQLMGNGTDTQRIDFYLSHHFDYRELIEKGLALEAPEGMYKTWNSLRGNLKEDNQGNIVGDLNYDNRRLRFI